MADDWKPRNKDSMSRKVIKRGAQVRILTGSQRGKQGRILRVLNKENRVVVDCCKIIKRGRLAQIREFYRPIDRSNVALIEEEN